MALGRGQKIGITLAVLLLLAALVLLFLRSRQAAPETIDAPAETGQDGPTSLPSSGGTKGGTVTDVTPTQPQPQPEPARPIVVVDEQADARRSAMAFAERYGSFSNTADYSNLLDLAPLMTASFASETKRYVEAQKARGAASAEFYGITTRALSAQFQLFDKDSGVAKAVVTTQRWEQKGDGTGAAYYQDITIILKYADGVWKADSAEWGDKKNL